MQTAEITVNSGSGAALWRGIPAQITIAGIEDVSGDWLFLVDNDNADGAILSGTVAAVGETLVVTLSEMNTVELAEVIQGRSLLQCRATLTDGASRVYIIPLTIRNRAIEGSPTPVDEYYTKTQIDAMIAGLEPGGTDDYDELDNKPAINGHTLNGNKTAAELGLATPSDISAGSVRSVNGMTGDVELDAEDVGAISSFGLPIVALESSTITEPGAVYTFTPSAAAEFGFPAAYTGKDNFFRLVITMPDPAVPVTFPAWLTWKTGMPTLAAGTTTELNFKFTGDVWEGGYDPDMSEYVRRNADIGNQYIVYTRTPGGSTYNMLVFGADGLTYGDGRAGAGPGVRLFGLEHFIDAWRTLRLGLRLETDIYHGEAKQNTPGGFCISDAETGTLTVPGDVAFTPTGASAATTLSALVARIEALEQAIQ